MKKKADGQKRYWLPTKQKRHDNLSAPLAQGGVVGKFERDAARIPGQIEDVYDGYEEASIAKAGSDLGGCALANRPEMMGYNPRPDYLGFGTGDHYWTAKDRRLNASRVSQSTVVVNTQCAHFVFKAVELL
jgi:hypothetical protein